MKKNRVQKLFLEQLRKIPIIQVTCEKLDISRVSIHKWRKADPLFDKAVEDALTEGETILNDLGEAQLVSLMKDKHWASIAFWLSHRHPRFKPKLEISGEVTHRERREYTEEEKKLFKEALRLAMPKDIRPEKDKDEQSDHGTDK